MRLFRIFAHPMVEFATYPSHNGKHIVPAISSLCDSAREESEEESSSSQRESHGGCGDDIGGIIPHGDA
jgi:hypothetical protein